MVDRGGQTVSATRFAQLTGVSRERLRTWERRHGFPRPRRAPGGPRRYAVSDAAKVIAVREAAAGGMPIEQAIRRASALEVEAPTALAADLADSLATSLPLPLAVLSGPEPLRLEYVNEAALRQGAPDAGAELLEAAPQLRGTRLAEGLVRLFASGGDAFETEHPPWSGARE